jgi:hypothetical protein
MDPLRLRLASAIRSERHPIERALAAWLQADPFFGEFRDLPRDEVRLICRDVLAELDGWLRTGDETSAIRARLALGLLDSFFVGPLVRPLRNHPPKHAEPA